MVAAIPEQTVAVVFQASFQKRNVKSDVVSGGTAILLTGIWHFVTIDRSPSWTRSAATFFNQTATSIGKLVIITDHQAEDNTVQPDTATIIVRNVGVVQRSNAPVIVSSVTSYQ
jgi:hypothetical protein